MTPAEQRLLLNEIKKQIALLQTKLRTLGDSEQEELNSLKQLLQTLVESKKEEERQREREQATPYQTFFRAMDELVEQRNNIFVQRLPHLIANFCTSVGVTFACHKTKNFPSFESSIKNLNPAQAQQLINGLRNQILSQYEEGTPKYNDINALILKIGEILRTKGTDPTIQTLFTQTDLDHPLAETPDFYNFFTDSLEGFIVLEKKIKKLGENPEAIVTALPQIISESLKTYNDFPAVLTLKTSPSFRKCIKNLSPIQTQSLIINLTSIAIETTSDPNHEKIKSTIPTLLNDVCTILRKHSTNKEIKAIVEETKETNNSRNEEDFRQAFMARLWHSLRHIWPNDSYEQSA
jgi:ElaB/YqjD/DUF883 family membrane-anchored ribosome-binding protein